MLHYNHSYPLYIHIDNRTRNTRLHYLLSITIHITLLTQPNHIHTHIQQHIYQDYSIEIIMIIVMIMNVIGGGVRLDGCR